MLVQKGFVLSRALKQRILSKLIRGERSDERSDEQQRDEQQRDEQQRDE